MKVFWLPPLPLLHLWNQANTKPSDPWEFLAELQLLALQQGLQNQVTTLTGSTLTAWRADFANASPLLSCCCQMGGEQRSDGTGQMLPLTTSCLWPGSLQGALHSSLIDSKIFIYLFILCTQSLLQPAGLIHHHYLILSIFFLPFFFFFFQKRAIPSWYLCPRLLGAYGTCKLSSPCVKSNKTRLVMSHRTYIHAVSFLTSPSSISSWKEIADKNNVSYRTGFSLEDFKAFYWLSKTRMILPISWSVVM